MPIEAYLNSTWAAKWIVMGVVLIGFGGLCIKDGAIKYPAENERYAIYEDYAEIGDERGWVEHAEEQGWSTDPPHHYSDLDIMTQWIMLGVAWPLGFAAIGMVLWFRGRKLVATEEELIGYRGERIPYNAITGIDKERWDSKGIAWVHYEDDRGEEQAVKIDDFVFRDAWRILDHVEEQTGLGQAVEG